MGYWSKMLSRMVLCNCREGTDFLSQATLSRVTAQHFVWWEECTLLKICADSWTKSVTWLGGQDLKGKTRRLEMVIEVWRGTQDDGHREGRFSYNVHHTQKAAP